MPTITFEPTKHEYFCEGKKLKNVTGILNACGLMQDYKEVSDGERTAAMEKGTHMHTMIALAIEGTLDEEKLDPKLKPYLVAFRKFVAEKKPKFHRTEFIVGTPDDKDHDVGWAGTCDAEATIGKVRGVIDWKSGEKAKWHRVKTYAYRSALPSEVCGRWCVYLGEDGNYKFEEHEDESDHAAWDACLALTEWRARRS